MKKCKLRYIKSRAQHQVKQMMNTWHERLCLLFISVTYLNFIGQDYFWIKSKLYHRLFCVAEIQALHCLFEISIVSSHFIFSLSYFPKYFICCTTYVLHQLCRSPPRIVCIFDNFIAIPNCYEFHIFSFSLLLLSDFILICSHVNKHSRFPADFLDCGSFSFSLSLDIFINNEALFNYLSSHKSKEECNI